MLRRIVSGVQGMVGSGAKSVNGHKTLVLGPVGAGKTAWLSSLKLASTQGKLHKVGVQAENQAMADLFSMCNETISVGRFPGNATEDVTKYSFSITSGRSRYFFDFLDGPGGAVFRTPNMDRQQYDDLRAQIAELLSQATGLVVCVDVSNSDSAKDFFQNFPTILDEAYFKNNKKKLPLQRVAFCLTKADKVFAHLGADARKAAMESDPVAYGGRAVTGHILNSLKYICGRGLLMGFCWTSVYGFVEQGPDKGYANYNQVEDCLEVSGEDRNFHEIIDNWNCFQIVEPLLFVVGEIRVLKTIKIYRG